MTLHVSHNCWDAPATTFFEWMCEIAKVTGYEIVDNGIVFLPKVDFDKVGKRTVYGEWRKTPKDPLLVLFAHSDSEGVIHPEQGIALAKRLEEILPLLPTNEVKEFTDWFDLMGRGENWQYVTRKFVNGLRLAHKRREDVVFL